MKTAVLVSGGVDSSVALLELQDSSHRDLTAYYLKIWLEDELSYLGDCPWEEDLAFAREVCTLASIPLRVVPLQREYFERVVQYVLEDLRRGNTPSPDIFCNQRIKFGAFLDGIDPGFDKIATGHYAIVEERDGRTVLKRGTDRVKDQTYFLSHLRQDQVARAIFPIGHLLKRDVRAIANDRGLPNRDRPDSQGICFLGKIKYPDFVRHYLGEKTGSIVEKETGKVLGEHQGFWFHTIGQRQGLGLGGGPWYVSQKDPERNVVYVTHGGGLPDVSCSRYEVTRLHWVGAPPRSSRLGTKIRHGPEVRSCTVEWLNPDRLTVTLDEPDAGVASGQFSVFYDGEICLGGGTIQLARADGAP